MLDLHLTPTQRETLLANLVQTSRPVDSRHYLGVRHPYRGRLLLLQQVRHLGVPVVPVQLQSSCNITVRSVNITNITVRSVNITNITVSNVEREGNKL